MISYIGPFIVILLSSVVGTGLLFFHKNLKQNQALLILTIIIILLLIYRINSFSIYPKVYEDQKFMIACQWITKNTSIKDLFVAFPFSSKGDALRTVCLRSVFVTYKDGGQVMYSKQYALEWNKRIKLVSEVESREALIVKIKKEYGVDYVFSDRALKIKNKPVFSNGYFIYKL